MPEASLSRQIEARTKRTGDRQFVFPAGRGLTDADRSAMRDTQVELTAALQAQVPLDGGAAVKTIVRQVRASFGMRLTTSEAEAVYDGYLIALGGRSQPACFEAVRRIVRSEAPAGYSVTFAPKPGELARLAMLIEQEWKLEIERLDWLAGIPEERPILPTRQPSEEEMAAVREKVAKLLASSGRTMPAASAAARHFDDESPAARVAAETASRKARRIMEDTDRTAAARHKAGSRLASDAA